MLKKTVGISKNSSRPFQVDQLQVLFEARGKDGQESQRAGELAITRERSCAVLNGSDETEKNRVD